MAAESGAIRWVRPTVRHQSHITTTTRCEFFRGGGTRYWRLELEGVLFCQTIVWRPRSGAWLCVCLWFSAPGWGSRCPFACNYVYDLLNATATARHNCKQGGSRCPFAYNYMSPTVSTLRGHDMKLFIQRARLHVRKYFFSHRVVPHWNSLPQHVVNAPSVNSFKSRLDTYWHDMDVKSRWASWSINNQVQVQVLPMCLITRKNDL